MSAATDSSTYSLCTVHYSEMTRVTIAFEADDLELIEHACRVLAEYAGREGESVKGSEFEQIHKRTQRRCLGMAERFKIARRLPDPQLPPSNVRPLRC